MLAFAVRGFCKDLGPCAFGGKDSLKTLLRFRGMFSEFFNIGSAVSMMGGARAGAESVFLSIFPPIRACPAEL